jgi:hypothetical protein
MDIWSFLLGVQAGVVVTFFALSLAKTSHDEPPPNG